MRHAINRVTYC